MWKIIFAVLLSVQGLIFIIGNAGIFWKGWIKKEKCPSVMPLLGGIFCAAAILLVVDKKYYFLAIIPMLLDWGCIPAIVRLVIFICLHRKELFGTETAKKRIKATILRTSVIASVVLVLAVCIIGWHGSLQIKSWHIFTNNRIEKLEKFYEIDFPEDTEFSSYSAVWNFTDIFRTISVKHTLYIKDVADPEKFCREIFNEQIKIMLMADIKNAVVIENNSYSEHGAEWELNKHSAHKEAWGAGQRSVDFYCKAFCSEPKSEHISLIYEICFSQNDGGGYDVKIFMETLG